MSNLAAEVLHKILPCPLSLTELIEDLAIEEWESDVLNQLRRTLRDLQKAGEVRRFDVPGRDESPFFGVPLKEQKLSKT